MLIAKKKKLQAKSTNEIITIDGKIDEEAWVTAPIATDFIMFEPDNGKPININKKTEVKILYDNTSIYISALLYDNEPNKISKELTNRDVFGNSDVFSVSINGFNDGQQDYKFYVSAAGVQMDCLATEKLEDYNWDAIWDSQVTLTNYGWIVEMKIPYSALRFSKAEKQTWGINFMREINRDFQKYTWNFVDTKLATIIAQAGILEGIENIKTPTRLFLIPYTSTYYQNSILGSDKTLKAGLDIKYGINDSFTLDAILVPDFGQTKFDNTVLNLEPFEIKLSENRSYFTEATDLFSKGGLFYSRRIGGTPNLTPETGNNEEVTEYPSSVNLINAIKISGRTNKGLGIGILNAITEKTFATLKDTISANNRKAVIQPLTNYTILVLDQRFNKNSSVSFINTNTLRNGSFRDANVSALLFDLNTKSNTYKLNGDFKYSTIKENKTFNNTITPENYNGYKTGLNFTKTSGRYRYMVAGLYFSKDYDINDLGINFINNYQSFYAEGSYRIINPTKIFNSFKAIQNIYVEKQNTTGKIQEAFYQSIFKASTLKNNYIEVFLEISPFDKFDFYEPRVDGRYVHVPKSFYTYAYYLSNKNKPFNFFIEASISKFDEKNRITSYINAGVNYRFNTKFSIGYSMPYWNLSNDRGWVGFDTTDIIFGQRNQEIVQSDFEAKYSISNKMTINLNTRYYWSYVENQQFFTLENDGYLSPNSNYNVNKNKNLNSWNFDLSYSWWFAPGSEICFLYRNYALENTNSIQKNISTNLKNVLNNNLTNILSISLRYYIDYYSLKKKY